MTTFTEQFVRDAAFNTYKVLAMTNTQEENLAITSDNVVVFSHQPQDYHFILWSRVFTMFHEDKITQELLKQS